MSSKERKINRRYFLKLSSLDALGVVAGISALSGCASPKSYYSLLRHGLLGSDAYPPIEPVKSNIHSTLSVAYGTDAVHNSGKVNSKIVQKMFDLAIQSFTETKSIDEAWNKIIPGLKSTDTVAIKINCINPSLPTRPEVVDAIIDHLTKVGVRKNNIIVWDRLDTRVPLIGSLSKSGYQLNSGDKGVKYITTATDDIGYDDNVTVKVPYADLEFPVSRIITNECKYLINVPQLRHHRVSGITQCMKNYYGVIPLFDTLSLGASIKMHEDNGNPVIPQLCGNSLFLEKTRLHVCDALFSIYDGGPDGNPQCILNKLMVGKDPVALDYQGLMIIEEERSKRGMETLMSKAKFIQTAAEMGLGTNNPQQMNVKQIIV